MEIAYMFGAAGVVMLASLAGVIFISNAAGEWLSKNLRYLITFAAGVFIIVSYNLFSESFEFGGSTLVLLFAAAAGGVVLEMLTRLVPDTHHHHGPGHEHAHTKTDARRLLMSDAIHNLVDGILLVPAFLIDVRLGFATLAAIFLHEVVQEISEFFVLKDAGYSTTYALTLNFTVSATILPGVIVGIFFLSVETLIAPLIAFAAGAFLYVVFRDLLPSTVRSIMRYGNPGMHLAAALTGIVVMFAVNAVMPHDPEGEAHAEPALQIPAQLR